MGEVQNLSLSEQEQVRRQKLEMQRAQFTPRRIHSHKRKQQHGNDQVPRVRNFRSRADLCPAV